jgi:hypothetical protein
MLKCVEIHTHLCVQYEDNVMPRQSVYKWIDMFKSNRNVQLTQPKDIRFLIKGLTSYP